MRFKNGSIACSGEGVNLREQPRALSERLGLPAILWAVVCITNSQRQRCAGRERQCCAANTPYMALCSNDIPGLIDAAGRCGWIDVDIDPERCCRCRSADVF